MRTAIDVLHEIALGHMGMPLREFDYLTPQEFNQALRGFHKKKEVELDNELWQTRMTWAIIMNSSGRYKKLIRPEDLMKLPGDIAKQAARKPIDKEEVREHFYQLQKRLNNGGTDSGDKD